MIPSVSQLQGFARSIPDVQTFVEPVFVGPDGQSLVQRVVRGRVSGFAPVVLGEEFESMPHDLELHIGGAPMIGFEMGAGRFLLGEPRPVSATLRELLKARSATGEDHDLFRPTRQRVARFIEHHEAFETSAESPGTPTFLVSGKAEPERFVYSSPVKYSKVWQWWVPKSGRPDEWFSQPQLIVPCRHLARLAGPGLWESHEPDDARYDVALRIIDASRRALWVSHKGLDDKVLLAAHKLNAFPTTVDFVSVFDAQTEVYRHFTPRRWNLVILDWTSHAYSAEARQRTAVFYDDLRAGLHGEWGRDVPIVIFRDRSSKRSTSFATHQSDRLFDVAASTDAVSVMASILHRLGE